MKKNRIISLLFLMIILNSCAVFDGVNERKKSRELISGDNLIKNYFICHCINSKIKEKYSSDKHLDENEDSILDYSSSYFFELVMDKYGINATDSIAFYSYRFSKSIKPTVTGKNMVILKCMVEANSIHFSKFMKKFKKIK